MIITKYFTLRRLYRFIKAISYRQPFSYFILFLLLVLFNYVYTLKIADSRVLVNHVKQVQRSASYQRVLLVSIEPNIQSIAFHMKNIILMN